ncbi:hypothetical protein IA57_11425 [Mangrovimonas yunxiaonensis]|uniref:OstA family protein n=1 Tax=Mangrovimonas yunxiaonensis TaxID=1197477 RepID=A0A084THV7_9FLAO|nr:hypothetical protein [Mangrovimonas yunxiaonensis]KFB00293.1 hypothetical protein IA57_11425 [Mangrovimonas yunxiaonensis]GGH41538.1 hypothetical protein GCM10011364_12400 [Mangrovimonas yunxiaonensis]
MKKLGLLFAAMLLGIAFASAAESNFVKQAKTLDGNTRYSHAQPIMFLERGIEFLVFPDGSFDFNTHTRGNNDQGDVYYRTRRSSVNVTFGAPRTAVSGHIHYSQPQAGVIVEHDRDGKVRRIGNVFINYDRQGRIKRAGSVYMSYQRGNGRLIQIGGLTVRFNGQGELVHSRGAINQYNTGFSYISDDDFGHDTWHDDDVYYYKTKKDKVKKSK